MNIQEAKDKLYDELLYTVSLCEGTEEDLLELIENLFYIYNDEPAFLSKDGMQYTIKEFMERRKTLESILTELGIGYAMIEYHTHTEYELVTYSVLKVIQHDVDNYTVIIDTNSDKNIKLSDLTLEAVKDILNQIK
ncbi:hypothetical protein RNIID_0630 [Staphylococcus phage phiRNIID]|nr:hypothetical protein RNIID_0630 [Staphylococcus phage phiRNIID]